MRDLGRKSSNIIIDDKNTKLYIRYIFNNKSLILEFNLVFNLKSLNKQKYMFIK